MLKYYLNLIFLGQLFNLCINFYNILDLMVLIKEEKNLLKLLKKTKIY